MLYGDSLALGSALHLRLPAGRRCLQWWIPLLRFPKGLSPSTFCPCRAQSQTCARFRQQARGRGSRRRTVFQGDDVAGVSHPFSQPRRHSIVRDFFNWCHAEHDLVLDGSPMSAAIGYAVNQQKALERFLDDGRLPMTNNISERTCARKRSGAICRALHKRKNWTFVGSEDGATANTTFVSLIARCELLGFEPWRYPCDLFYLLPDCPSLASSSSPPPTSSRRSRKMKLNGGLERTPAALSWLLLREPNIPQTCTRPTGITSQKRRFNRRQRTRRCGNWSRWGNEISGGCIGLRDLHSSHGHTSEPWGRGTPNCRTRHLWSTRDNRIDTIGWLHCKYQRCRCCCRSRFQDLARRGCWYEYTLLLCPRPRHEGRGRGSKSPTRYRIGRRRSPTASAGILPPDRRMPCTCQRKGLDQGDHNWASAEAAAVEAARPLGPGGHKLESDRSSADASAEFRPCIPEDRTRLDRWKLRYSRRLRGSGNRDAGRTRRECMDCHPNTVGELACPSSGPHSPSSTQRYAPEAACTSHSTRLGRRARRLSPRENAGTPPTYR
ncbi:MAG: hypothetical protein EOO73_35965 [Myxococcales bacterium]|nr:MAG: hypothetical protein EOO73_35965 [Myxococcales bacterium]